MADPVGQAEATTHSRSSAPRVRLTCEACRQRKVKCDKSNPCAGCQRLGLVCVPVERARLPRGRTRKSAERTASDKDLSERVARLENLLQKVVNERHIESHSTPVAPRSPWPYVKHDSGAEANKNDLATCQEHHETLDSLSDAGQTQLPRLSTAYLGKSFWEDIMQQTHELRSVLDNRLEDEVLSINSQDIASGRSLMGSESPKSTSDSLKPNKGRNLPAQLRRTLCDIYFRNVDPVFKILHRPSLEEFLKNGKPYLDYEQDHQAPDTLAAAVYLCAVCTLDDTECESLFIKKKKTIVAEFQKATEVALERAGFVTTNDLTVLQAYIISLLAARSQDQSRRVWTMLSMALRVAQALSLHVPRPPFTVRPFEHEMRKRAWLGIGLLDIAACLDRASEPMMQSAWLDHNLPSNINDEEICLNMDGPIHHRTDGTFTDMTHTLLIAAATSVTRALAFSDLTEPPVTIMSLRHQAVHDFQQKASDLLRGCRPDVSGFQWYSLKTAAVMGSWLQLASLRPLQRSRNFTPPGVYDNALLKIAADNLKWSQEAYNYPGAAAWRWYSSMWVPWHALAVAVAELCVCKDSAVISKYWSLVDDVYQRSRLIIADSQQGMLWKPMERLMEKAKARRNELLNMNVSHGMPHYLLDGMPSEILSTHTEHYQPLTDFSLCMGEAINESQNALVPGVSSSFTPVPWPNVRDAMDLSDPAMQTVSDNTAWLSYENFIENVYDSVDSIFLPQ